MMEDDDDDEGEDSKRFGDNGLNETNEYEANDNQLNIDVSNQHTSPATSRVLKFHGLRSTKRDFNTVRSSETILANLEQLARTISTSPVKKASSASRTKDHSYGQATFPLRRFREDVSYKKDNQIQAGISTPAVKPSTIAPALQIVRESTARPPRLGASAEGGSEHWDEASKTWKTLVFPVAKPVGRNDVLLLDEWLKSTLSSQEKAYKQHVQAAIDSAEPLSNARKVMILVNQTIPVLTAAMNEVTRQVSVQCVERGQILDNVWSSFMEIFDKVLGETTSTMSVYQQKMDQLQADNTSYVLKLQSERGRYLEAIKNEKQTVEVRMTAKLDTLKEKLSAATAELKKTSAAESECRLFFPRSAVYRKSVLREMLHEIPASQINTNVLPDDALAQDIVRLVDLLGGNQSRQRLDASNAGSVSPGGGTAGEEAGAGEKDKDVKGSMKIIIPSPSALIVNRSETDNSVRELLLKQLNQIEKENKTLKQGIVGAERKHAMMMGEIATLENKVLDLKSNLRIALNSSTSGATSLQQFLGDREVMITQNISSDPTKSLDKMKANIRILATLTNEEQGGSPQASMEEISLLELGVPLQMRRVNSLEKLCWLLLKRKLDLTTPTKDFTTTKIRSLCEITFEHFLGVGGSYSNGRRQLSYFIESLQMLSSKSTLLDEFARLSGLDKDSKLYSHSTLELYFQLLHKIYLEQHKHWKVSVSTAIGAIKAVNLVEVDELSKSHGGIDHHPQLEHSPPSTRRRPHFIENVHVASGKDSRDTVRSLYHISLTRDLYADLVSLLTEVSDKDGHIDMFVFLRHVAQYWEQVEGQTTSVLESLFTGADVSCGNSSMLLDTFMLYMKWAYPKLDPEAITDVYNTCVSNPRNIKVGFISPSVFALVIKEDLGFGVPPEFKKNNLMALPRAATEVVDTWIDEEGDKFVARIRDLAKSDPYTYSGLERRLQHVYKCNDKSGTGSSTKYPDSSWFALKIFLYEYNLLDCDTKEGSSFGKKLTSIANYLPVTFNRRKVLPKVFDAWRDFTMKQIETHGSHKNRGGKKKGSTSPVHVTRNIGVTGVVTTLKAVNKMHRRIRAAS